MDARTLTVPVVSVLVLVAGIALSRLSLKHRWVVLLVGAVSILAADVVGLTAARDAVLGLTGGQAIDPVAAHATVNQLQFIGLQSAAIPLMLIAFAEALGGPPGDERRPRLLIGGALGGLAAGLVLYLWLKSQGVWAPTISLSLAAVGLASGVAAWRPGDDADAPEHAARGVTVTIASLTSLILTILAQHQLWVWMGFTQGDLLPAQPWPGISGGLLAGVLGLSLAVLALVGRRFWRAPDRFSVELIFGVIAVSSAMMIRMPVLFALDRVLAYTPGGQLLALEMRTQRPVTGSGLDALTESDAPIMVLDASGLFELQQGLPVETPPTPVTVGMSTVEPAATLSVFAPGTAVRLVVQLEPATSGLHPMTTPGRFGVLPLAVVAEPAEGVTRIEDKSATPGAGAVIAVRSEWTAQDLVDLCSRGPAPCQVWVPER